MRYAEKNGELFQRPVKLLETLLSGRGIGRAQQEKSPDDMTVKLTLG